MLRDLRMDEYPSLRVYFSLLSVYPSLGEYNSKKNMLLQNMFLVALFRPHIAHDLV